MKVINALSGSIRRSKVHYNEVQAAPACILWPDRDRQWEAVIPLLQSELPELLILGEYHPEKRTGPAIWLRCAIAGKTDDIELPVERLPIIYLPGVSRQDLRAVESCPEYLKPLAELQYRGAIWSQLNTRDWTILAFLKSDQGGLGLDVASDNGAKNAMQLALPCLLDEEIDMLKGKKLDKDYFNTLLTGGDPVRDLLQWLDQGEAFRIGRGVDEWRAFVEVCKSQLAFNPEDDGILAGAAKLASHKGPWAPVWERFCEAPKRYPNIPVHIRQCKPPSNTLTWHSAESDYEGWPQWNEKEENGLRKDLELLDSVPPHEARKRIAELEKKHSARRPLVWAELGESSLARSLEHLLVLAQTTTSDLAAGTTDDLAAGYLSEGWKTDDAVLRALACVLKQEDFEAVKKAIRSIYITWAEESARHLQKIVLESGYPGGNISTQKARQYKDGECVLFVDGLRLDAAKRLGEMLTVRGYLIEEKTSWAALPSVTATGRPAVMPVRDKIAGQETNTDFEPCVAETGQSLKGGYQLKKLLNDAGWEFLDRSSNGIGKGNAWCELENIDHEGHDRGWKLAIHLEGLLGEIRDRVIQLLAAGWKSVRIVTDHGWLLLPGGIPKIELPSALTETKWGRCAAIKPGAVTDERLYPWFWNQDQDFALADGISCFRKGEDYTHGGLSLQECLTPELLVSCLPSDKPYSKLEITDVAWKGLRCTIAVDGEFKDLSLDIRTQPGNSSSSIVVSIKQLKENRAVSVIVENEELQGTNAIIVLFDPKGNLAAQLDTVIGGSSE